MYYRNTRSFHSVRRDWKNTVKATTPAKFTNNQIALQTFIANGLISAKSVSFATSVANANNASPKQIYWVDKLVNDVLATQNKPVVTVKPIFDNVKLFTLFDNAIQHLKYPKVTLCLADSSPVRLSFSKKWDAVFVAAGGFGTESYAKICRDGDIKWYTKDAAKQQELSALIAGFAADPEKVAHDYGKLTHNCCYCTKQLDTAESLAVGYGPVCAKHWHLPWGKTAPRVKPNMHELVDGLEVMTASAALKLDPDMNDFLLDEMT